MKSPARVLWRWSPNTNSKARKRGIYVLIPPWHFLPRPRPTEIRKNKAPKRIVNPLGHSLKVRGAAFRYIISKLHCAM